MRSDRGALGPSARRRFSQSFVCMKRLLPLLLLLTAGLVGSSQADSTVVFNEIMYHPATNEPAMEWVELRNQLAVDVDMSDWSLTGGVQYIFPPNTVIRGRGYLVVAISPAALMAATGANNVLGPFTGRLGNNGETLRLRNNSGRVVDEVVYDVEGDWPVAADGSGASLAKRDPESASAPGQNWTASEQPGGTPGLANFTSATGFVAPPGLVSYWSFNESGTTALDQAGLNHGTLGSGTTRAAGGVGGALLFNGLTNGFVNMGPGVNNSFAVSNGLTIEAVLQSTWNGNGSASIFRKAPAPPTNYTGAVLASAPVAYWRLNDATTTIVDTTVNARNGLATAGVQLNQPSLIATDPGNTAIRVGGTDRITVNGFEKIGAAGYSVEYWVKVNALPVGCCQNLVGDGEAAGDYFMMNYILGPAQGLVGGVRPHFGPGNSPVSLNSASALQAGSTYHIVTTWDTSKPADNAVIYINGVANTSGTISRNVPAAGTTGANRVYIGKDDRDTTDGNNTIDEVALYNRPLSATDVAAHYLAGTATDFGQNQGNAIQLAFQNDGNNALANPPVAPGPVLSFGLTVNGVYSELDMPLDGQAGRPTLGALQDGQPHHVTATYNPVTGLKAIYVDGTLRFSTTLSGALSANNGANAVIGNAEVNGATPFIGRLDEVAFWGRALSPTEVSSHANAIQAGRDYFAPTMETIATTLAFSEVSSATNSPFFVEIVNYGDVPVALGGLALRHDGAVDHVYNFPGTTLNPGAFLAVTSTTLGFQPISGDKFYLSQIASGRVIDAVVVKNRSRARFPQISSPWAYPVVATPGAPNIVNFHNEIVINEIMYNHALLPGTNSMPPRESPEAWIELHNRSASPVDLAGWQLAGGISYFFTAGQTIPAGGYVVIADDVPYLQALYPGIHIVGDFGGRLSGKGDHILLKDPNGNVADEVRYSDGGSWPEYADGGGSSLELCDPRLDNSKPEVWAASYEGAKSQWVTNSYRMIASIPAGNGQPTIWADFILGLLGPGECLIDDLSVIESPSGTAVQLISNGSFQSGIAGWRVLGTHGHSFIDSDPADPGNQVLHVVATGPQEHMHNHVERTLNNQRLPQNGLEYQISYRAKWVAGNNLLNTRLYFNRCARTMALPVPGLNGTPGAPNPDHGRSGIPTFSDLAHQPVVPQPGQAVTVSVTAEHFDGAPTCQLFWSVNGGASNVANMIATAGGHYVATIPGESAGAIVQFWIRGERLGASAFYPAAGPDAGALYAVADGQANFNAGHNIRIVLTPANAALMHATTNVMSNDRIPGTVIYDETRAYYNVGVRLKGSQRGRANADRISYHLEFPKEDPFRGVHPFMLVDRSGAGDATANKQQEILIKHILLRAGNIPSTHPDMCRVIAPNPVLTGSALLSPRLEDDFVETAFENGGDGSMWELELIYYLNAAQTNQFGYKFVQQPPPNNDSVTSTDIGNVGNDPETYRYNFMIKMHRDQDDYAPFMAFAKTWSLPAGSAALDQQSQSVMDVDEWMRVWALVTLCGVGDTYTYGNNHNLFMYLRPSDQKMVAFPADMDFSFNRAATAALVGDQNLSKIINLTPNLRRFYAHILDIINVSYNTSYMNYWVNHYQSFTSPAQNYSGVINYIQTRVATATSTINSQTGTGFTVAGADVITSDSNLITLTGTASAQVATIKINGVEYPVTWTSLSAWRLLIPVSEASNVLNIATEDIRGNPLTNFTRAVTVIYSGPPPDPQDAIVINEIMYNPAVPDTAFIELFNTSDFSFDLSGWRINGVDFTFSPGSIITNGQFLVLASKTASYFAAYGTNVIAPSGQFAGNLQNDGETLTLLRPGANPGEEIVMDKVRYESLPAWPTGPNGGGQSLQLIDAAQDNSRVGNWSDGTGWRYVAYTGTIAANGTNLLLFLNSAGDVYLDDFILVAADQPGAGPNLLVNGGFESPLTGSWTNLGNHSGTEISTEYSHGGNASLHLIATGGGGASAAARQVIAPLPASTLCSVSFWFRPTQSASNLTVRTTPGSFFSTLLSVKPVFFTPGAANTAAALLPAFPDVWLNEVQPENLVGVADGQGDRDPWIEIYNSGNTPVSLDGYYLANDYTNLTQWAFPAGAVLQPGEFKVVFADGEPGESTSAEWHTGFRLNSGNGSVALSWSPGGATQILDYLNYTNIQAGRSYGDFPDGQPFNREQFYRVTAGGTNDNVAPPIVVYLNEWMAANTSSLINSNNGNRFDDWIELYNPGNTAANLAGYFLTDNLGNKTQFPIPPGYIIPPHGFLLVWADGEGRLNTNSDPALHVNFRLSQDGEAIGLFASDGIAIDTVDFRTEPQFNNVSQGRFPDGPTTNYFLATPTPMAPNSVWANRYPVLAPIADAGILFGETLAFDAAASDPDQPAQALTFTLGPSAPTGAVIHATSGAFSWSPASAQSPSTNLISIRVADNGTPSLTAARTFKVVVGTGFRVSGISRADGEIHLNVGATVGKTYRLEFKDDLNAANWSPLGADQVATSTTLPFTDEIGANPQRFYRVRQLD
jgi:hypothetical protein